MKCSNVREPRLLSTAGLEGQQRFLEDNPFVNEALSAKLSLWGTDVVAAPAFSEDFVKSCSKPLPAKPGRIGIAHDYNLGAGELTGLEASNGTFFAS